MDKYELNENEEIEFAEKERDFELSQEEGEQLTFEKRQAEADEQIRDELKEYHKEIDGSDNQFYA